MIEAIVQYIPQLLQGFVVTLSVAVGSFVLGLIFAVVLAPAAVYGSAPVRKVIAGYVSLIRGLPELLVIFLIFYGGTVLLSGLFGGYVEVDALTAGIAALTVVSTAYLTEIVRGALAGVSSGQWEAALALGLRRPGAFRLVVLPQMMVRALPGLGNQWLVILKESALVSIIGLEELMRKSVVAAGATHKPLAFYLTAAALYVLVTGVSTLFINACNRRLTTHLR
ncbi:His/Glu/Gln/Arg/opine family amino acid ABC transporter permease subunit [Ensifer adhaerens]|uniref:His/Glu/Gln/Arg/opine family amino acid ABC transporter permease subunit n=1 Tax=Ensifer adhaerens TaxID=106592 RepID=A0ACC5T604_ENSAD|nr:ABC transporter permease subunit [Ensifer adhaerens]MBP1876089.1 His/Glu/Gln/Arg/opine family amino acid ABC transporter permease subunit [Ensifer adhaerens]